VTARDELFTALTNEGLWDEMITWANGLIDDHAHELAEKIREEWPLERSSYGGGQWYGANVAADLIDPEVDNDRTDP
jgi:hypothetical protein